MAKMRLICPNCGAQYEVPDEVIPEAGRDVQCSNCGTTWFQTPEGPAEPEAAGTEPEPAPPPSPEPQPVSRADAEPDQPTADRSAQDAQTTTQAGGDTDRPDAAGAEAGDMPDAAPAPPPEDESIPRRRLDPAVASLLREEAERESRARAGNAQPLESQPDLGLEDGAQARSTGTSRAAEKTEGPARTAARSRGAMLPDIDEINRDLTPAETEPQPDLGPEQDAPAKRAGFSRGFALALLIAAAIVVLYVQAERLAEAVPALSPLLAAYVAALDAARTWTYETITSLLTLIEGLGGA